MGKSRRKIGWQTNLDKLIFIFASLYFISVLLWWWKIKDKSQTATVTQIPPVTPETLEIRDNLASSPIEDSNKSNLSQNIENPSLEANSIILNKNDNSLISNNQTNQISNNQTSNQRDNLEIPPLPQPSISENLIPLPPVSLPSPTPLPVMSPPPPLPPTVKATSNNPNTNKNKEGKNNQNQPNNSPTITPPEKLTKLPTIDSLTENKKEIKDNADRGKIKDNPIKIEGLEDKQISLNEIKNNVLIGVVELPDSQGMALFEINKITEKVKIGNEIGSTGWVLMAVNGKQAVISRYDESLYIQVGEKF